MCLGKIKDYMEVFFSVRSKKARVSSFIFYDSRGAFLSDNMWALGSLLPNYYLHFFFSILLLLKKKKTKLFTVNIRSHLDKQESLISRCETNHAGYSSIMHPLYTEISSLQASRQLEVKRWTFREDAVVCINVFVSEAVTVLWFRQQESCCLPEKWEFFSR